MLIKNIESSRLFIRLVRLEDSEFIFKHNVGNVAKYFIKFDTLNQVNEWVNKNLVKINNGEKLEMIIEDKSTGERVGMVALDNLNSKNNITSRVWISQEYQGKGYAHESLITLFRYIQNENKYSNQQVIYEVDIDNIASIALAKKLGFELRSKERDKDGEYYVLSAVLSTL